MHDAEHNDHYGDNNADGDKNDDGDDNDDGVEVDDGGFDYDDDEDAVMMMMMTRTMACSCIISHQTNAYDCLTADVRWKSHDSAFHHFGFHPSPYPARLCTPHP